MARTVRLFGLWLITVPRGSEDRRVFAESRSGDWPVSLFQRKVGIRLFPTTVYRRSFARMGQWKGFFMTHAAGAAQTRLQPLVRKACKDIGCVRARFKLVPGAEQHMRSATGHAVLWAPRMRLLRSAPGAKLAACMYVKAVPSSAA